MLNAPQSTSTRQWPMANGRMLWLSTMSILKCRDLRGLNATGALVSLTFPTATAQPSSSSSPLFRSLPSPTPTSRDKFRGRHKKRERTTGNCLPLLGFSFQSPPRRPAGCAAATRIRRPRAIDSISRTSVPGRRPRSKDPTRLGLFASSFVGKDALLESIVHFPLHNSKFSFSDGYQSVHFCSGLLCFVAQC